MIPNRGTIICKLYYKPGHVQSEYKGPRIMLVMQIYHYVFNYLKTRLIQHYSNGNTTPVGIVLAIAEQLVRKFQE